MKDITFYVTKNQTVKEILYVVLSFLWWILPLQIFVKLSIFPSIIQLFMEYPFFFIIQSIFLCLSPLKRAYFSFYYPIIRISDLYFIHNFDKDVTPWTSIEKIILNENSIKFSIKNKKIRQGTI